MKNGLRLEGKKEASLSSWAIRRPPSPPALVRIPLDSLSGSLLPCVRVGSRVRLGEKIADSQDPRPSGDTILNSGAVKLSIVSPESLHASVSGEVTAIDLFPHPVLGEAKAIEIRSDGRDEKMPEIGKERFGWENLSSAALRQILRDSGVDLSVIASPDGTIRHPEHFARHPERRAQCKLREGSRDPSDASRPQDDVRNGILILNGCESEPYVTSDHALMMSHPVEILRGGEILRKILGAACIAVALEDNKMEVTELLKSKIYFLKWNQVEVRIFKTRYPQGAPEILMQEWKGENSVVLDIATAFAAYEAVVLHKPRYERAVTVGGECVIEPKNFWLRLGTRFEEAFKGARGFLRKPHTVLMGGPMKGRAQTSLEVPVLAETQAVLALPEEVTGEAEIEPCIRCGLCVEACPVFLSPAMITLAAERELYETAREWGASRCIDCGNCAYVCPSKRPMLALIHQALKPSMKEEIGRNINTNRHCPTGATPIL